MQEISQNVFIETQYPGITLGAINLPHGLILIDAPTRPDDVRTWRGTLLTLGGGINRLLVNLDAHPDRTLGARAMECTVVGQEMMAEVFHTRPTTFKTQNAETGAEWEMFNGLGSIRWNPPEITFSQQLNIHWGDTPVALEFHPGPSLGNTWIHLPVEKIVFLGDSVVQNQPPFFSQADIPVWIETLKILLTPEYQNYIMISSRSDLITTETVRQEINYLQEAHQMLENLAATKSSEDVEKLVPILLSKIEYPVDRQEQYTHRLKWGLEHYFVRHYQTNSVDGEE